MFDYTRRGYFEPGKIIKFDNGLEKPSPIFFGYDIEDKFIDHLEKMTHKTPVDRFFFLTDPSVFDRLGSRLFNQLKATYPNITPCFLPKGESGKTFTVLETLCDELVGKGASKGSMLIAFGGGSVGNISGLAAGLIFRGIRFVEVPTTLSHQTDGTLSNKQAVNGKYGKNHFGVYHSPVFTWTDVKYLETERLAYKKSGIVEGIKNGMIDQDMFLPYLEKNIKTDGDYEPEEITDLCYKLIVSKIEILKKDPTEKQYGMILEYGHTFGHAVEWLAQGELTHGEGVAIGMKMAAELAYQLGYIEREVVDHHYTLIDDKLDMKPAIPAHIDAASILETMYVDNKKLGDDVKYVLLESIGQCKNEKGDFLLKVDREVVREVVERFIDQY